MDLPTAFSSTLRTGNSPAASLRERSSEDLIQAIHSPGDDAYTITRARTCLRLYFEADMLPEERAAMLDEFARALADLPRWTVARAFDAWVKTGTRRPTPAEIRRLALSEVDGIKAELDRRWFEEERARRLEEMRAEREQEARLPPSLPTDQPRLAAPRSGREVIEQAGFTASRIAALRAMPMARSFAEADASGEAERARLRHWSETAPPDAEEWEHVRIARSCNPLVQAAREDQARGPDPDSAGEGGAA
ncbi:hypothetical protein ORIO_04260 [Cereibacter azotoformans]|uniref:hypothetical protein n=1 Tax=Cereibacter azotoformans TaxID=43057 RepID=UPI001EEC00C1|nr:hypothetical protein [Cereibacter azotoformans]ULB09141.1 hypothetical protein ORIO_04260 [Cereibacter azotoformans]